MSVLVSELVHPDLLQLANVNNLAYRVIVNYNQKNDTHSFAIRQNKAHLGIEFKRAGRGQNIPLKVVMLHFQQDKVKLFL